MTDQKTTTTTRKTKAGRPKGAKTAARSPLTKTVELDGCPACGSKQEPINKRTIREGEASGQLPDGRTYGAYKHVTCNCAECGRRFLLREYTLI